MQIPSVSPLKRPGELSSGFVLWYNKRMDTAEKILLIFFIILMFPFTAALYFSISQSQALNDLNAKSALMNSISFKAASLIKAINQKEVILEDKDSPEQLLNPPEIIKAVYVTGWSAGDKKYIDYLMNLFKTTEINAVVIDIKDFSGYVSYNTDVDKVKEYKTYENRIPHINELIKKLHGQGIYVIARITVFQDPALAKNRPDLAVYDIEKTIDLQNPILWKDNHGLYWLDPASREVWDYNISIAKDAVSHGFDEISFDYIRFPADGKIKNMGFPIWDGKTPMRSIIKEFFQEIRQQLPNDKISVDLFGQTTVSFNDMGIGQLIEDSFDYFDYVCPMVYPSHYISGFMGFLNPAEYPYEVVKNSMETALEREKRYYNPAKGESPEVDNRQFLEKTEKGNERDSSQQAIISQTEIVEKNKEAKIRPWLQDFNMGANYTEEMVKAEIKAVKDALGKDFNGFMLWNPSNVYTKAAISLNNSETE